MSRFSSVFEMFLYFILLVLFLWFSVCLLEICRGIRDDVFFLVFKFITFFDFFICLYGIFGCDYFILVILGLLLFKGLV